MVEQLSGGHAIWLEPTHLHFHHGDNVEVKVLWGIAMKKDSMDNSTNWRGEVIDPNGLKIPAKITSGTEYSHHVLTFNGGPEGIYTVQVEGDLRGQQEDMGASAEHKNGCYYWARMLVPLGHHVHGSGKSLKRGIEIVPEHYSEYHPGDTIELTVLKEGKPLAGVQVLATYHIYDGDNFPYTLTADSQGKIRFSFAAKGHWMFQLHSNMDGKNHIATLVVPGVR